MKKKIIHYIKKKIEILFKIKINTHKSLKKFNKSFEIAIDQLSKSRPILNYNNDLTCIIFSKDRALQLYALLESIHLRSNINDKIYIIYKTTNSKHEKSYENLIYEIKKNFSLEIEWVKEKKLFKESLLLVLRDVKTKKIFFLTDDDVFINYFDKNDYKKFTDKNYIFSLRLSSNISYSYNLQKKIKVPSLKKLNYKNYFKFKWFETDGEWSYPWSVNGHIFSLSDILTLTSLSDYSAPNSYESALQAFNFYGRKKIGICPKKSFLINLPVNITQSEIKNKSANMHLNDYLKAWKQKKKLDIQSLKNYNPCSVHEEHLLRFIDR